MADAICSSLVPKSLSKSPPFPSHYTAPKPLFVISFQHSIHTKRTRRRRPPRLHFACLCTQNSPDFDVISTDEHSDGSFLFRFGDPSELVKNDQLEESDLRVEGKGSEDEEDFSVDKIIESDHRREVIVKKIGSEEKSEDCSEVVESESRSVFEIESSSGETSSSSSVGVQVLVSGLSLDVCDSSELTEQVDDVLHRRGNIELNELNDSVESDVEDFVHEDGNIEVNDVIGEEYLVVNDGYESSTTLSRCPPENDSEPKDEGASAGIVQPLSGKNEELISLEQNHVVEVNRDSDNIKERLIRNDVDQREAWLSLSLSEHGFGPEDHESSAEITESITGRNQELVSPELDPVVELPTDDVGEENNQEKIEVAQISHNVDDENVAAGPQNNTIEDSSKSEIVETLSLSSPLEAEPALHEEENATNVEVGSEREVTGALPPSPPLEAGPVLDDGGALIEKVGSHNDTTVSSSESEGIGTLLLSPPSEAEPVLDEQSAKVVEAGTQNDVMGVFSESEAIEVLPLSTPLEAEPFLDEGHAEKEECGTENEINETSSESELILTSPPTPPLEVQPVPDNDAELEQTEILNKSNENVTTIMINTSSETTEEKNIEISGVDEVVDSSDSEKTVLKPILPDLQSEKISLEKLFLSSGTASLPHPEKALAGGEDAFFTSRNWFGVADGVSRWSLEGVDHGKYAHEVMETAREIISGCGDTAVTSPDEVLNLAIARAHYPGSSTVLISHFDGKDLHVANIGDSGVMILRNGAVYQKSSPMFHEYNFPVLIDRDDDPSKLVERYKYCLDEGDIVVAATDGLFDNLYEQEIISTVSKSLEANINPKEIAEILVKRAHEVGSSGRTRSPFSDAAQAAGYTGCTGGKLDDVVVVVSLVTGGFDSHSS